MQRGDFIKKLGSASYYRDKKAEDANVSGILECCRLMSTQNDAYALAVVLEKLSALTSEVAKASHGHADYYEFIQYIADVSISLNLLQKIYGISDADLQRARNVKFDELKKRRKVLE